MAAQRNFKYFVNDSKKGRLNNTVQLCSYKSDAIFNFIFHNLNGVFEVYRRSGEYVYNEKLFLHKVSTIENNKYVNVTTEITFEEIKEVLKNKKKYEQQNTIKIKNNEQEKKREFIFNIFTREARGINLELSVSSLSNSNKYNCYYYHRDKLKNIIYLVSREVKNNDKYEYFSFGFNIFNAEFIYKETRFFQRSKTMFIIKEKDVSIGKVTRREDILYIEAFFEKFVDWK
jgi:hypothetical protein